MAGGPTPAGGVTPAGAGERWLAAQEALAEVSLPSLAEIEEAWIDRVLAYHEGNLTRSAQTLGVSRSTLKRKLARRKATKG